MPGELPRQSALYLATIVIQVPLKATPGVVGGRECNHDQMAAWEAASALGFMIGNDAWERIGEAGNDEILGLTGEVSRLERLSPTEDVEPEWHKACPRASDDG